MAPLIESLLYQDAGFDVPVVARGERPPEGVDAARGAVIEAERAKALA